MRRKKLSVFAGICAILVMTACGKKSIEDDIGVNTEKKEVSDNKENTELDDKEVKNGESKKNNADDEGKSDSGEEKKETIVKAAEPLLMEETDMSEAIVIENSEDDILKAADGKEIDYPLAANELKLPSFYISDLVDNEDYVTPVRNQGHTALCWIYSSLGAIECDLLVNNDIFNSDTLNLSEKHGAYYNMHKSEGSNNSSIDDDYREFVFPEDEEAWLSDYDTGYISVGGVTDYSMSLFTAWKGPVLDEGNNSFKTIKGQSAIYTDNTDLPSGAYDNPVCHVQGVYEIKASEQNRELIKRLIVEHGGVSASINADDSYWTGRKVALFDYKPYGAENVADHEILIVGWDDEYDASHFITKPENNGAFICKNSWGTGLGAQGYFYLSYEDSVLCNNNVAAYDCAVEGDSDWYDKNYQYAGFITHVSDPMVDRENVVYMYDPNVAWYGIRITPTENEVLSAVGYFAMGTNSDDTVEIYEVEGDKDDYYFEEIGEPVATQSCRALTGGYHTFPLDNPVDIIPGKEYLIVVKPGKRMALAYEKAMDTVSERHYDEWQHNLGLIHTVNTASRNSYLVSAQGEALLRQEDKDFFVKAYTKVQQ